MPNRLIREEMLESERVLALPVEARWLYVTVLLSADDLGLFEATSFKLARRSDIRREAGEQLLSMLSDADLVRLYEVDGKRFGFIPRFRQRIQIRFLKHPPPPEELMRDDLDALNKIKQLASKTTVGQRMANGFPTDGQPSEAKAKAKAYKAMLDGDVRPPSASRTASTVDRPSDVDAEAWQGYLALRRAKRAPVTAAALSAIRREAGKAGITLQAALETCCAQGWTGFRADWIDKTKMTAAERAAEAVAHLTGKRDHLNLDRRTIDVDFDPVG